MGNKLLLADDSITIQKVVGIIFANEDYALTVVDNGNAALEKAREVVPDVILADVLMPGRNGYEVCEEIRRDPVLKHTPLLLLTGAFEPFDEDKARQCGADDFISKPFESQQLIDKVKRLIDLGRERKAAAPVGQPVPAVPPQPAPPVEDLWAEFAPEPAAPSAPPLHVGAEELFEVEEVGEAELSVTEEIVEAVPEEDLWGAFELEEVGEGEAAEFEAVLEEEDGGVEVEEEFSFAEEEEAAFPETAAAPPVAPAGEVWETAGEEAFTFEEESGAGEFAAVAAEEPEMGGVFEFAEEEAAPLPAAAEVPAEPVMGGVFEFPEEPVPPVKPADELPFAPEEEYVPVIEPAAPAAAVPPVPPVEPLPAAAGELTLSEEQLASVVSRISRELLEKIAWEVVPDLAEAIIREEIRKIKEGR